MPDNNKKSYTLKQIFDQKLKGFFYLKCNIKSG